MTGLRVGGEVDAPCTRCKMVLAHTIIAMVGTKPARVQCNTCGGQHNYRSPHDAPASTAKSPKVTKSDAPKRPAKVVYSFEEELATKSGAGKPYSPQGKFLVDEVLIHPTLGRGFVTGVRDNKIDVMFKAGVKTLMQAR